MKTIYFIGGNGMVGSRIVQLLKDTYQCRVLARSQGVDITKPETLSFPDNAKDAWVVHLAAKTNVDACQADKESGKDGEAWKINVEGTANVVKACQATGKKLIFISTDFVFDGKHMPDGGYTEYDVPDPINWYGRTKYEAERIVQQAKTPWVIARIAYPYRASFAKNDFMRAILSRLENGESVQAITDHVFSPTFVDDIVQAIDHLITADATGIYHVTGSQLLSPYDAGLEIVKTFGFEKTLIEKTTREQYFAGKAPRPFQLGMNNDKIKKLGVQMSTFERGLEEVKKQRANC